MSAAESHSNAVIQPHLPMPQAPAPPVPSPKPVAPPKARRVLQTFINFPAGPPLAPPLPVRTARPQQAEPTPRAGVTPHRVPGPNPEPRVDPVTANHPRVGPYFPPALLKLRLTEFQGQQARMHAAISLLGLPTVATIDGTRSETIHALLCCPTPPSVRVMAIAAFVMQALLASCPEVQPFAQLNIPVTHRMAWVYKQGPKSTMLPDYLQAVVDPLPFSLDRPLGGSGAGAEPFFGSFYLSVVAALETVHHCCNVYPERRPAHDARVAHWFHAVYAAHDASVTTERGTWFKAWNWDAERYVHLTYADVIVPRLASVEGDLLPRTMGLGREHPRSLAVLAQLCLQEVQAWRRF
jgi:hypothetical protein